VRITGPQDTSGCVHRKTGRYWAECANRVFRESQYTPLEALRSATYSPAVFFGKSETEGTVERGKVAELVLLNANPLDDIANARKIDTVITGGRIFRKPALEDLLRMAEAAARA
jgi:imidazolonepropionase-like amidohydrolase